MGPFECEISKFFGSFWSHLLKQMIFNDPGATPLTGAAAAQRQTKRHVVTKVQGTYSRWPKKKEIPFLNASKYCGSVLKNDFVVLVVVVLVVAAELLSNFQGILSFRKSCRNLSKMEICCGCWIKINRYSYNIFFKILEKYIDL